MAKVAKRRHKIFEKYKKEKLLRWMMSFFVTSAVAVTVIINQDVINPIVSFDSVEVYGKEIYYSATIEDPGNTLVQDSLSLEVESGLEVFNVPLTLGQNMGKLNVRFDNLDYRLALKGSQGYGPKTFDKRTVRTNSEFLLDIVDVQVSNTLDNQYTFNVALNIINAPSDLHILLLRPGYKVNSGTTNEITPLPDVEVNALSKEVLISGVPLTADEFIVTLMGLKEGGEVLYDEFMLALDSASFRRMNITDAYYTSKDDMNYYFDVELDIFNAPVDLTNLRLTSSYDISYEQGTFEETITLSDISVNETTTKVTLDPFNVRAKSLNLALVAERNGVTETLATKTVNLHLAVDLYSYVSRFTFDSFTVEANIYANMDINGTGTMNLYLANTLIESRVMDVGKRLPEEGPLLTTFFDLNMNANYEVEFVINYIDPYKNEAMVYTPDTGRLSAWTSPYYEFTPTHDTTSMPGNIILNVNVIDASVVVLDPLQVQFYYTDGSLGESFDAVEYFPALSDAGTYRTTRLVKEVMPNLYYSRVIITAYIAYNGQNNSFVIYDVLL